MGISTSLSEYMVPELLVDFHQQFPIISVRVLVDYSQHIDDALSSGVLNIGIIERDPSERFSSV